MKRVLFVFCQFHTVSYNFDKRFLEIFFRNGTLKHYVDVPSTIYFSLLNAYSPDKYFEENIRHIFFFTSSRREHG